MSDKKLSISISAKNEASPEIKKLKADLETLGKIDSFTKLKRETAESLREWNNAQAKVKELAVAMRAGGADVDTLRKAFEKSKTEAAKLKDEYVANRTGLDGLRKSLTSTGVDMKNLTATQELLRASTTKTKEVLAAQATLGVRPYKAIQTEIAALRGSYETLRKSGTLTTSELYAAKQKLKEKTAELRKETGDWATSIGQAKAGLLALAGAGYAAIKSFQRYSEFSQRMGEVNTQIDVSKEKFAGLTDEIRGLTKEIPQTASELAAAEYDILSAGVALEKSVGVLEQSAKAAVAGVTDTKTAANVGISVINAYGKSIDELGSVYDILFQTVKLGVLKFEDLAQSLGQVLPTAKAAGINFTDLAGSIAALTKVGLKTPMAITALRGAINALAAPADTAKEEFDKLGITWQGLIPTLDALRKKNLSIDQMRNLIPDVEARTGVLALTQNFDVLTATLSEMANSTGSMEEAYAKMKDTPANQMKLFTNEIDSLMISAGALVSKGLLPVTKALRSLIDMIGEADPATKLIIASFAAVVAGTALWKMGLGTLVTALGGMITKISTAQLAVGTLNAQFTASGALMKAGLAGSVLYTSYQLATLAKEMYLAVKAGKELETAQTSLTNNADQLMKKYEEFKDFKLPGDITTAAQADLAKFRQSLAAARTYYTALKVKLEQQAEKTTALGQATDEAKAAQKELVTVNARLTEIQTEFDKVGAAAAAAATEMQKPTKAVDASTEQLDEFEKAAKAAYDDAKKAAADYAQQVIAWEEKIKYAKLSTEDKIRELGRLGLTEAQAWNDQKLQADQKYYAAKQALAAGDYELAEKLAKDAEGLYAGLATTVKTVDESGKEVVSQSLEDTKTIAINGVKSVGTFMEDLYGQQKSAAATALAQWQATADAIKAQLDTITKAREAKITITLSGLSAAQSAINALTKDETKYIRVVTINSTVEAKKTGGMVGLAGGGKLAGYGGGDRIRALLEAGEFVVRKEAVQKYGAALFNGLNAMSLNLSDVVRARVGGLISNISMPDLRQAQVSRFAAGGMVGMAGGGEVITLNFTAGGVEMPLKVIGNTAVTRGMVKEFERELVKMGLSKR